MCVCVCVCQTFLGGTLSNSDASKEAVIGVNDTAPCHCVRVNVKSCESPLLIISQSLRVRLIDAEFSETRELNCGKLLSSIHFLSTETAIQCLS